MQTSNQRTQVAVSLGSIKSLPLRGIAGGKATVWAFLAFEKAEENTGRRGAAPYRDSTRSVLRSFRGFANLDSAHRKGGIAENSVKPA